MDILIVEDHEMTHKALMTLARRMGWIHAGARNYEEAVQAVNRQPPQVLLTDWDLGEENSGIDVANYAAARNEQCQIIFYTGNRIDVLKSQVGHLSGCRFIQKPLSLKELKQTLIDALAANE